MQAMLALNASIDRSGLPKSTVKLIQLRVSQINGCSVCV
ncbi:MAG: carboxymuconolactone decarboxylase family protein, partial [Terracidiphilus sp.]